MGSGGPESDLGGDWAREKPASYPPTSSESDGVFVGAVMT